MTVTISSRAHAMLSQMLNHMEAPMTVSEWLGEEIDANASAIREMYTQMYDQYGETAPKIAYEQI
jgi:hypothetical protein